MSRSRKKCSVDKARRRSHKAKQAHQRARRSGDKQLLLKHIEDPEEFIPYGGQRDSVLHWDLEKWARPGQTFREFLNRRKSDEWRPIKDEEKYEAKIRIEWILSHTK